MVRRPGAKRVLGSTSTVGTLGGTIGREKWTGSRSALGKTWRDAPSLQAAKKKYKKRIAAIRPHEVDFDGLAVKGVDLFQWAARENPFMHGENPLAVDSLQMSITDMIPEEGSEAMTGRTTARDEPSEPLNGPFFELRVTEDSTVKKGQEGPGVGPNGPIGLQGRDDGQQASIAVGGGAEVARGWPRVMFETKVKCRGEPHPSPFPPLLTLLPPCNVRHR